MDHVITVDNLTKKYGSFTAVDNISFSVKRGEIFCVVGPNGAGKTSTIEALIGLRKPNGGELRVLGYDPQRQHAQMAHHIGVQLQEAALPDRLTVAEALDLYSSFYRDPLPWQPLLAEWGLTEKANARFEDLSGGQKQRLFITLALLNDPEIIFLDELTTGLDPQARRSTWEMIRSIQARGKTVVLITHFMEEAQELADRVAIIDHGKLIALDTPAQLIEQVNGEQQISVVTDRDVALELLEQLPEVTAVAGQARRFTVHGNGTLLAALATMLAKHNVNPLDLNIKRANLEDVFLSLTGREVRA